VLTSSHQPALLYSLDKRRSRVNFGCKYNFQPMHFTTLNLLLFSLFLLIAGNIINITHQHGLQYSQHGQLSASATGFRTGPKYETSCTSGSEDASSEYIILHFLSVNFYLIINYIFHLAAVSLVHGLGFKVDRDPLTNVAKPARGPYPDYGEIIGMTHSMMYIPRTVHGWDKKVGCCIKILPPAHLAGYHQGNIFEAMQSMSFLNDVTRSRETVLVNVTVPLNNLTYVKSLSKFYCNPTFKGIVTFEIPHRKLKMDLVLNVVTDCWHQNPPTLTINEMDFSEVEQLLTKL